MKQPRITSKQVAKLAGVSQTTVSFVLNNVTSANISEETSKRVLEAARELGYVPDAAAQNLARGHSRNLGLVLMHPHYQIFRDPYVPNVMTGLSGVAKARGYRLLVEHIEDLSNVDMIRNLLKGGEVAGLVLSTHRVSTETIYELIEEKYPIVLIEIPRKAPHVHAVGIDHIEGVKEMTRYLISLGHKRIACITYGPLDIKPNDPYGKSLRDIAHRLTAFRETLEEAGLEYDLGLVRQGNYDPESAYEATRSLLDDTQFTAIFGMNDMMALGAMHAIQEAGIRIPDDISVVGYDDMRFAAFTYPALTTMRAPEVELGHHAGEMLINLIEDIPIAANQVELYSELVVRASSGAVPIS